MIAINPLKSIVGQIRGVLTSILLKYRLFRAKSIISADFDSPYWYVLEGKNIDGVIHIINSYKLYYDRSEKKYIAFDN